MRRGEPTVKHTPTAWWSSLYEGCMAISTLWPCGLGCHMLGLHSTACLGTNLIHNHMLQTKSYHAQHLARTGQVRMTAQNLPATWLQLNKSLLIDNFVDTSWDKWYKLIFHLVSRDNSDLNSRQLRVPLLFHSMKITLKSIARPLFPGLFLITVNSYKTRIVPNNNLNPAHPITVAQAKPQPKDQMWVLLPFKCYM